MKKKIIFLICIFIIFAILLFSTKKEKIAYTVTLDINPSIEINLDKNKKVLSVKALNEDAEEIIDGNFKGEDINDVIIKISDNVIEKGYASDNNISIIIYSKDTDFAYDVQKMVADSFEVKNIFTDIILIEEINDEDRKLARENDITPAKAAYINSITKENDNLVAEELTNKSVRELAETKRTGNYCDEGYNLEGDFCLKEIDRFDAQEGLVCPIGYYEYNGECYEEVGNIQTDKKECPDDLVLDGDKCIKEWTINAKAVELRCESGTLTDTKEVQLPGFPGSENGYICVDTTNAVKPELKCMMSDYHIVIDGKCYNGPAPLIDGGCPGSDLPIGDGCYSLDDEDQWQCPAGNIYHVSRGGVPEYCPETVIFTDAIVEKYECDGDGVLDGNICKMKDVRDPRYIVECPEGYDYVDGGRCININNKIEKQDGYVCEHDNSRTVGKMCVIYDIKEAYHN